MKKRNGRDIREEPKTPKGRGNFERWVGNGAWRGGTLMAIRNGGGRPTVWGNARHVGPQTGGRFRGETLSNQKKIIPASHCKPSKFAFKGRAKG